MIVYEVISRYMDGGKSQFKLNEIECDTMPQNSLQELKTRDVYHDYFLDKASAEQFIEYSKADLITVSGRVRLQNEHADQADWR